MWLQYNLFILTFVSNIYGYRLGDFNDYNNDNYGFEPRDYQNSVPDTRDLVKRVPQDKPNAIDFGNKLNTFYIPRARDNGFDNEPLMWGRYPKIETLDMKEQWRKIDDYLDKQKRKKEKKNRLVNVPLKLIPLPKYNHKTRDRISLTKNIEREDDKLEEAKQIELLMDMEKKQDHVKNEKDWFMKKLFVQYKNMALNYINKEYGDDAKRIRDKLEKKLKSMKDYVQKRNYLHKLMTSYLRNREDDVHQVDIKQSIFNEQYENMDDQTVKPKVFTPHVPYWNYWTYEKNIHTDNCKGNLVKYHNMCIELAPH